jgi:hypothetical protein
MGYLDGGANLSLITFTPKKNTELEPNSGGSQPSLPFTFTFTLNPNTSRSKYYYSQTEEAKHLPNKRMCN